MKKYYLTTPIYYVNAAPHIGHAYTTIVADTIKRLKRMQGYDVVLTTGTDEHGQKIERAAKAVGKSEREFVDVIANEFREQWNTLNLSIDHLERATSPSHAAAVQDLFRACQKNDPESIYKGHYSGQYCVFDELYVSDAKPGDPCPDCGRITETVSEENYFFRLARFRDRLLKLYADSAFIQPEQRRNEVLAFINQGPLKDLSITRTTIKWGVSVPDEPKHVFYVWFDALMAYKSAVDGQGLWPADLHLIGKEIVRFHAIYWPAFLMAAGWDLPKSIFAHGWLLFENDKMSKSRGNIVRATPIHNVLGTDALRFFLLRKAVFGQDGSFSCDARVGRYSSDLANGLGNLASRTLTLIHQNRGGAIPASVGDQQLAATAKSPTAAVLDAYERFEFSKALDSAWALISAVDKFIVERAPWKLAKEPGDEARAKLDETLYTAAEAVRLLTVLLSPVIPESAAKIRIQLGCDKPVDDLRASDLEWGGLPAGQKIGDVSAVFPRADAKVSIDKMKQLEVEELARQQAILGKSPEPSAAAATTDNRITIDDFIKVDLRVGQGKQASAVKGSDKLLHLFANSGEAQPRSIVAGIAEAYKPDDLVGRKVVIVANLQPRKLRGLESQGMIVAASLEDTKPVLAAFLEDVPIGARLK